MLRWALTTRPIRRRFAARLNPGVRPLVRLRLRAFSTILSARRLLCLTFHLIRLAVRVLRSAFRLIDPAGHSSRPSRRSNSLARRPNSAVLRSNSLALRPSSPVVGQTLSIARLLGSALLANKAALRRGSTDVWARLGVRPAPARGWTVLAKGWAAGVWGQGGTETVSGTISPSRQCGGLRLRPAATTRCQRSGRSKSSLAISVARP